MSDTILKVGQVWVRTTPYNSNLPLVRIEHLPTNVVVFSYVTGDAAGTPLKSELSVDKFFERYELYKAAPVVVKPGQIWQGVGATVSAPLASFNHEPPNYKLLSDPSGEKYSSKEKYPWTDLDGAKRFPPPGHVAIEAGKKLQAESNQKLDDPTAKQFAPPPRPKLFFRWLTDTYPKWREQFSAHNLDDMLQAFLAGREK